MVAKWWKKTKKGAKVTAKVAKPVTKRIGKVVDNAIDMQTASVDMMKSLSSPGVLIPIIVVGGVVAFAVIMKK